MLVEGPHTSGNSRVEQRGEFMSDAKVTLTIKNNGPIRVEGEGFEIKDAQGQVFNLGGRTAVSICRCGASKKQPFCDGSHGECKFASEVTAYDLAPK